MTLDRFQSFDARKQVTMALLRGTRLAHRWENGGKVTLYYLDDGGRGFFVELGQDMIDWRAVILRSFSSSEPLEAYACWVRLPGE